MTLSLVESKAQDGLDAKMLGTSNWGASHLLVAIKDQE